LRHEGGNVNEDVEIQDFDPLSESLELPGADNSIFQEATRRVVENILKSYTGYFDAFSEMIQNALDAIDARRRQDGDSYHPALWIDVDIRGRRLRVTDNGIGMDRAQFLYCFRPNVSFKSRRESRGHKGVGATFLAYGYSVATLHSKRDGQTHSARLRNGRQWADDQGGHYDRPKLEQIPFLVPELEASPSGTSIEIVIGDGQRPNLAWLNATRATQWSQVLRSRTPLGGVYLKAPEKVTRTKVFVRVTDAGGNTSEETLDNPEYMYPHEIEFLQRVQSIRSIQTELAKLKGDPQEQMRVIPEQFKRLDASWEVWDKFDILDEDSPLSRNLDTGQRELIERHNVVVYACFVSTAKTWNKWRDEVLQINKVADVMKGGLVIASDHMVQGDRLVIPLTSAIGYQANTHIIVHFSDGNPDMGRKAFQPELKTLAEELAKRVVDIFKKYISLMREDAGNPIQSASRELQQWLLAQEQWRSQNPLDYKDGDLRLAFLSSPRWEQDVVALFHELIGMGVIRGYGIYATSEHFRYDSLILTDYPDQTYAFDLTSNRLGVGLPHIGIGESGAMILEYKYNMDGLIADFDKEEKYPRDVKLCVCWELGDNYKEHYSVESLLVGTNGGDRIFYGSTHKVYKDRTPEFEVVCLHDLMKFLLNPQDEEARQKALYN